MKTQHQIDVQRRRDLFKKLNERFTDKRFRDFMNSLPKIDVPLYDPTENPPKEDAEPTTTT